jgi:hypothetical protein
MGDTDPDKLEAALEQLETEKARRLQAKIDAGECVSVQTAIVVSARDDDTEAERTRALANLPKTTPDGRAIHHDLFFVVTGVPRADPDEPSPQVQTTAVSEEGSVASPSEEPARSGPLSSSAPTYVSVTISMATTVAQVGSQKPYGRWTTGVWCLRTWMDGTLAVARY